MNISTEKLHQHGVFTPKSYSNASHLKKDPLSNSNASLLKIDSISIDLLDGNEKKEVESCKHFSIRGYVGEIRKRDKKLGWPFSLDDKHNNSEESTTCTLPPIAAAKFRWWRCQNCLREIDPQCTVKEIETVENFSRNGQKSNNSACSHMSSHKEAEMLALVLVNNNSDIIGAQTCTNKSESIGVDEAHNTIKDGVSSSIDGVNHKFREHSSYTVKFDPCLTLEKNKHNNAVAIESNYNGFVETRKPICEGKKTAVNGFDDETMKLMTVGGIFEEKETVNTSVFATNDHENENNPRDYSSSDSDEIIGRQNRFAKHDEKSSTFRRAKPRKICLLSDILLALDESASASAKKVKSDENPSTSSGQTKKRKPTRDFSDKDVSMERGSQAGKNDHRDKHGVDGNSILNKKVKKPGLDDRCTSILPLQEVSHGGNEKRVQDLNKSSTSDTTDSTYQSSTGKATDSVLQSVFPGKESEKKLCSCKKKSKVPQPKTPQTFPMPWSVEPMHTGIMPDHQNCLSYIEPRWDFLLTGKEGIFREDQINRKDFGCKYVGESSRPYKSSVDTCTDKTVQWDLNFKTGDKVASIITDKPNRPPHVEDGNLPARKNKDVFRKRKDEKSVRVKEHSKSVEKQSVQNGDKVLEKEAIDGIPMEIIELLAKHPYEKRLKDAEKASTFLESVNKVNSSKRKDVKELHANGELNLLAERNRSLHKSQSSNSKKNGFTKGESVGSMNQKAFRALEEFSPCQQAQSNETRFPMNGIWPSMIQNHTSYEHQASTKDILSRPPETVLNGKIRNYDLNFLDLNVGSYEKQIMNLSSSDTTNKKLGEYPSTCNKRIELEPQMERSASMYSNETIPAMHLLSLMDSGRRSSTPFNLDQQKTEFIKRPTLPHDQHSKELSWPSDVSKHASLVDYGKKYPFSEKSCECLSAVSAFGALTSSLQNDISVRRITDSHGQVPKKSMGKSKANRRPNSKKSVSTNVDFHTDSQLSHGHSNEQSGLGAYSITYPSQQRKKMNGSIKVNELKSQCAHGNETIRPVKRKPKMEICIVNRNPADFTMPVTGNEYMISGNDLYCGRKSYPVKRSALTNISPQKKKRLMKRDSSNEHAQNQIPSSFTASPQQFFKVVGSGSILHTK